jgi:hypothetical protein
MIAAMSANHNCRQHLADFFSELQNKPAKWLRILAEDNNSDQPSDCLSELLGMNKNELYIPLMLSCRLMRYHREDLVPSIYSRNGYGYTWSDFFIEFNLNMEVSCIYQKRRSFTSFVLEGSLQVVLQFWSRFDKRITSELAEYVRPKLISFEILQLNTLSHRHYQILIMPIQPKLP